VARLICGAFTRRLSGEMGVEPRAVEDPPDSRVGEEDLRVVGRFEDDVCNPPRHPVRAVGIDELAQPGVAHALGTPDRRPDRAVTFQQDDVELWARQLRLPSGDGTGWTGAYDQNVDVRHGRRGAGSGEWFVRVHR